MDHYGYFDLVFYESSYRVRCQFINEVNSVCVITRVSPNDLSYFSVLDSISVVKEDVSYIPPEFRSQLRGTRKTRGNFGDTCLAGY